ncbi:MAG: hypothetical protein HGA45_01085 [Chloroflexales bacterium]|nr:hypothetical protein [Chloroflexales bacterium]
MRPMLVVVLSLVVTLSPMAARGVRADLEAVYAAETAFNALSANNVASALSAFAPEAVALNLPRDEQYVGREEIRQMLYQLTRSGRTYDIIGLKMAGSNLELTVAMSDYDRRWGTMTVTTEEQNGLLTVFRITAVKLTL